MEASEPPKRSHKFRWLRWLLGLVVALVFLSVFVVHARAYLQAGQRLLIGWMTYFRVNWQELTLSPLPLILAGLIALAAVYGLHRLAMAWRTRQGPDASRWRLRWSLGIVGMLLASSTAAIAFAGVVHQIAWMNGEPWETSGSYRDWMYVNALDLGKQVEGYATNHEAGRYPDRLIDVDWVRGPLSGRMPEKYFLFRETRTATPEPWVYYGKGLTIQSPPGILLLATPRPIEGKRWVVLTPSKVEWVPEAEFESMVKRSMEVERHD